MQNLFPKNCSWKAEAKKKKSTNPAISAEALCVTVDPRGGQRASGWCLPFASSLAERSALLALPSTNSSTLECNIHTINLHLSVSTQKPLMAGKKKKNPSVNYCQAPPLALQRIPPLPLDCKAILRFFWGDPEWNGTSLCFFCSHYIYRAAVPFLL